MEGFTFSTLAFTGSYRGFFVEVLYNAFFLSFLLQEHSISRLFRVLHFLHLLLQALFFIGFFVKVFYSFLIKLPFKEAFIKKRVQSVEVVKPSISRVWLVLHFLHLLLQVLIEGFFVKLP